MIQSLSLEASFLHQPATAGLHCHCASLLRVPDGATLAVWYAYPREEYEAGKLVLARRAAGQAEWEEGKIILKSENYSLGNPVIFQAETGAIWIHYVILKGKYWDDAELHGICSSDGGRSWSPPIFLWNERGMMIRHHPVAAGNSRLLLPAYRERTKQSLILWSDPPYEKWHEGHRFEGLPLLQPTLVRERSGRLSIFFRPTTIPLCIWRSHSSDDGKSWSDPVRTTLPNPLSGIAAVPVGDQIGMIYNHTEEHQRYPLSFALSPDGGLSWSEPAHIDEVKFELSYPHFLSDGEGRVHGVYTYNRRMIKYVAFSLQDGEDNDG